MCIRDRDDEFIDEQVGENFVFDISRKYLGENLDACDELFDTEFEGYTFSKTKPKEKVETTHNSPQKRVSHKKPWWKFW